MSINSNKIDYNTKSLTLFNKPVELSQDIVSMFNDNPKEYTFLYLISELFVKYTKFKSNCLILKKTDKTSMFIIDILDIEFINNNAISYLKLNIISDIEYKVFKYWFDYVKECISDKNNYIKDPFKHYKCVSLDGNISSGKSTFLRNMKKEINFILVQEPVDEWSNIKNSEDLSILELFYRDKKKYSFLFQLMALFTRCKNINDSINKAEELYKKINKTVYLIFERTILSDFNIFANMLFMDGLISINEFKVYSMWFNLFYENLVITKCIYLKSTPEVCYERLKIRAREGEECIPLEYLVKCDKYNNDFLNNVLKMFDTLVIDADKDISDSTFGIGVFNSNKYLVNDFIKCS